MFQICQPRAQHLPAQLREQPAQATASPFDTSFLVFLLRSPGIYAIKGKHTGHVLDYQRRTNRFPRASSYVVQLCRRSQADLSETSWTADTGPRWLTPSALEPVRDPLRFDPPGQQAALANFFPSMYCGLQVDCHLSLCLRKNLNAGIFRRCLVYSFWFVYGLPSVAESA